MVQGEKMGRTLGVGVPAKGSRAVPHQEAVTLYQGGSEVLLSWEMHTFFQPQVILWKQNATYRRTDQKRCERDAWFPQVINFTQVKKAGVKL